MCLSYWAARGSGGPSVGLQMEEKSPEPGRAGLHQLEGTVARAIREQTPWLGVLQGGRCRTPLRAAQLRLLLGLFQSDRLTEGCAAVLEAGRVTETIAACLVDAPLAEQEQRALDARLWEAAEGGDAAAVVRLAREGASADAKDKNGYPAVAVAAYQGHTEVVEALLRLGCDPNAPSSGRTALMLAAISGHSGVVGALLEHGGLDLDTVGHGPANSGGWTALMLAALSGQAAVVAQLVEAGADATLRTTGGGPLGGKTALGIAEANREFEVAAVLRRNRPQPEPDAVES